MAEEKTEVIDEQPVLFDEESKKKKIWRKIRGSFFWQTMKLALFLVLLASIGAGYAVIEKKSDPAAAANQYLSGYVSGRADLIYDVINYGDNNLMTVETLQSVLQEDENFGKVTATELGDYEKVDGGVVYQVPYEDPETGEEKHLEIRLINENTSFFNPIKKWKVDFSDRIVHTVKILVPEGCTLYVDGREGISTKKETVGETNAVAYYANAIYKGMHHLTIGSPYTEQVTEDVEITRNDTVLEYQEEKIVPRQDAVAALQEFHNETLSQMYKTASDFRPVKEVTPLFPAALKDKVSKAYQDMRNQLYGDVVNVREDYEVEKLTLDDLKIDSQKMEEDGLAKVRFSAVMRYRTARKTTFYDGYSPSYEGAYKVQVLYQIRIKQDGSYEITDIKFTMKETK